jgi:hypothetical protein
VKIAFPALLCTFGRFVHANLIITGQLRILIVFEKGAGAGISGMRQGVPPPVQKSSRNHPPQNERRTGVFEKSSPLPSAGFPLGVGRLANFDSETVRVIHSQLKKSGGATKSTRPTPSKLSGQFPARFYVIILDKKPSRR